MQQVEFRSMGCKIAATVDDDGPTAARLLGELPGWFAAWEVSLSRFQSDSELNRLNRSAGRPFPLSPVLEEVLYAALQAEEQSSGLVTPAVLDALETAGYDRTFSALPGAAPLAGRLVDPMARWLAPVEALQPGGMGLFPGLPLPAARLQLDPLEHTARLQPGLRLDLGGIAKGWAAQRAAELLNRAGPALVEAGGDLAASGPKRPRPGRPAEDWYIRIENPFDAAQDLGLLCLACGGVATSGRDYRRWQQAGRLQHHLIDPRTGQPAVTDVLTASVIAPDTARAEMAAKTALILGSDAGMAWLDAHPDLAGLLVLEDGRVLRSCAWSRYTWSET
ncbi:MAG: FAD:protein FMN transferase [Chloroflexota bacterium]